MTHFKIEIEINTEHNLFLRTQQQIKELQDRLLILIKSLILRKTFLRNPNFKFTIINLK